MECSRSEGHAYDRASYFQHEDREWHFEPEIVFEDKVNVITSLPVTARITSKNFYVARESTESTISIQKVEKKQDQNKAINSDQSDSTQNFHEADESLKLHKISNSDSIVKHQEVRYNKLKLKIYL